MYNEYVVAPSTLEEANLHMKEFTEAGFPGFIGSVAAATHITMMRCPHARSNQHKGPKESLPARTYNLTVNHRRQILNSTHGHPCRWNDKTIILFDKLSMDIRKGKTLDDVTFEIIRKR
jgi:Plant transposon protein